MDHLTGISTRTIPQSERADVRQRENNAGGFTFTLDDTARLKRFLVLGADGGTYYASAHEVTKDNAEVVLRMAREDTKTLVDVLVDVSLRGAAPKQNPTLFALAAACGLGDDEGRRYALQAIGTVCRIPTHLFLFLKYVEQFRGWGRGLRNSIGAWYTDREVDQLAYQMVKYRNRESFTHRDVLRLAHPVTEQKIRKNLFDWACGRGFIPAIPIVEGFQRAQTAPLHQIPNLVRKYRLSWEMLTDEAVNDVKVWDALLDNGVPATALMRQLPRLTRLGMLPAMGGRTVEVAALIQDSERLVKARVHPVNVLIAQATYAQGHGMRGSSEWTPTRQIVDALDAGFYAAFGSVTPAGKHTMIALDVSGSMTMAMSNMPITCRAASAAMALVTMATEPAYTVVGFTSGVSPRGGASLGVYRSIRGSWGGYQSYNGADSVSPLNISPRQRLDDVTKFIDGLPFNGTDCAAPMLYAQREGLEIDTFVVYTDNETWSGTIHPHQALRQYREHTGINAKLVVVGMTATEFTIADPSDSGMLDIAGFDSAVPNLISDFSRGF